MVLFASSICVSLDRSDRRLKIKKPASTTRHANDPRVKTGLVCGISVCGACLSICMRCFFNACSGVVRRFQLADSVAPIHPSLSIPMKYVQSRGYSRCDRMGLSKLGVGRMERV
jgi:hypothetical protein